MTRDRCCCTRKNDEANTQKITWLTLRLGYLRSPHISSSVTKVTRKFGDALHPILTQHLIPETAEPKRRGGAVTGLVVGLSPAYFAMVMATGIVSLSAHMLGMTRFSTVLLVLNVAAYGILWALNILRIRWFTERVIGDLTDHQRGPGFFTAVAGSCIL